MTGVQTCALPILYIGSTGEKGLHHLVYEIVDNSVDEALAGFCSTITVTIQKDNSIKVEDDGRGMPVDMHPKEKKPAVEVIHTVLHAGGKFDNSTYKVSGGLHGVGASVVNALSTRMEIEVKRDGKLYSIAFAKGETVQPLKELGRTRGTGSKTIFWPASRGRRPRPAWSAPRPRPPGPPSRRRRPPP